MSNNKSQSQGVDFIGPLVEITHHFAVLIGTWGLDILKYAWARYGREINFRDLVIHAIPKLNSKDIEKNQDSSLTEMERVKRLLDEHNEKNKTMLSLGEFLVKKLSI
jgi:hypothetical protein